MSVKLEHHKEQSSLKMDKKRQNSVSEAAKGSEVQSSFKFPCESYVGVTNLWLPSLTNRVSVQHTKEAKRSCPPPEKHVDLIFQFPKSACEICAVKLFSYIRNDAHVISLCLERWWAAAETVCTCVPKDLTCDLSYYHRLRVSGTLKHTSILMVAEDVTSAWLIVIHAYKPDTVKTPLQNVRYRNTGRHITFDYDYHFVVGF